MVSVLTRRVIRVGSVTVVMVSLAGSGLVLAQQGGGERGGDGAGGVRAEGQRTEREDVGSQRREGYRSDADDIRWTLARLADNALSKDGFDNMVMRCVDADRNRLGQFEVSEEQQKKLDGRIEQIRKAWKAKYGDDFRARRYRNYLAGTKVEEGEIGRDARLASEVRRNSETATETGTTPGSAIGKPDRVDGEADGGARRDGDRGDRATGGDRSTGTDRRDYDRDLSRSGDRSAPSTKPSGESTGTSSGEHTVLGAKKDAYGNTAADQNLEEGRNIAVVSLAGIPGSAETSGEIRVPLIHEFPDAWKVNVPDRVTGEKLYSNLLKELTVIGDSSDNWPANADEAYRVVTYRVLMAMLDTDTK